MNLIFKATENDFKSIVNIGTVSVEEAHRASCSKKDLNAFLKSAYNDETIKKELQDPKNIYHLLAFNDKPVGFSKIILDAGHPDILQKNITKLDRIYLLKECHGLKLGYQLLKFNIDLSINNNQAGMWLFTWVGNQRAVDFYLKMGFTIAGSDKFKITETHYNPQHLMYLSLPESRYD
jgi:ribosomal protein S18 acetylase RimI-like enzyme